MHRFPSIALILLLVAAFCHSQRIPAKSRRVHSAEPPVTDYTSAELRSEQSTERTAKHWRMRSSLPQPIEDPGKYTAAPRISTVSVIVDSTPREGLPVAQVSAIVLGHVLDSAAFVTPDKTGVYSEFMVQVQEVLKQDKTLPIGTGTIIVTTRHGGAVHFPSGHVQKFVYEDWGFPKQTCTYLLFLWRDPTATNTHDYGIYTAYEINDGKIYALDDGEQFALYEASDASLFVSMVREAILASSQKGGR